jgi:hypothetical protein
LREVFVGAFHDNVKQLHTGDAAAAGMV